MSRIGLIDSAVDSRALGARARLVSKSFVDRAPPHAHGTAVAMRLLDSAGATTTLYAADVYGSRGESGDAATIARALGWMAQTRTPVVNVSLVGPSNLVLAAAVRAFVARGHLLVAPVGNDGPASPALYPAAYPGVIAVTAVDGRRRLLPEAGRSPAVSFAAPGIAGAARGTSFAAPVVAGRLAQRLVTPDVAAAAAAVRQLAGRATDLCARGRDPLYGHGFVDVQAREVAARR